MQTKAPGYLLHVADDELDVVRFQRLVEDGRLKEALTLWRGPPLAEFAYERFAQGEIARLEELRLACLERRIEHDLDAGRHAELVAELERARRRASAQGTAPSSADARALSLRAAGGGARGVPRSPPRPRRRAGDRARSLAARARAGDPRAGPIARVASAVTERARRTESRGAFVGREAELNELLAGLEAAVAGRGRLFLVSGEPGIGKSRLADELIARGRLSRCPRSSPGAAGRRVARRPTGRGYSRCGRTCGRRRPSCCASQLGTGAVEMAQILPELRELSPGCPSRRHWTRTGRAFACSARPPSSCATHPRLARRSWSWTICTPQIRRRSLLLRFLARELGSIRLLVLGAYRDVDPVPGHALSETLVEVIREPETLRLSLGGLSEREVMQYVE